MIKVINQNEESEILSLQRIYDILTDKETFIDSHNPAECNSKKAAERLIAWLPNIKELGIFRYFDNDFIDVTFKDGDSVRLYNTGYELAFERLVSHVE